MFKCRHSTIDMSVLLRTERKQRIRGFDYTSENKCEQLFSERGKFDYTWFSKHTLAAYEKCHCCLKSLRRFSFSVCICITNLVCFIQHKSVNIQLNSHSMISSSLVFPFVSQTAYNPRSQSRLRCYRVNLRRIVYDIWPWATLWNKNVNVKVIIKKKRKVMPQDKKIKIQESCAVVWPQQQVASIPSMFCFKSNFPLIFYFNAQLSDDILLYYTVHK
jgi:hypothetical protein